jgi:hypothetical protein
VSKGTACRFAPQDDSSYRWVPAPRTTRPGVAPVCRPSRKTWTPFTNTCSTPVLI